MSLLDDKIWSIEHVKHRKGGKTLLTHEEETVLGTLLLDNDPVALTTWTRELVKELMLDPEVTPESFNACLLRSLQDNAVGSHDACQEEKSLYDMIHGCRNQMQMLGTFRICCFTIYMV